MDNILVIDKVITPEGCNNIIDSYKGSLNSEMLDTHLGYEFCNITNNPALEILSNSIIKEYIKHFPDIELTADPWVCYEFRLKHFPPNYYFKEWHSEHSFKNPYRIACIMIYLTDHDCGTEFYDGEVIKSVPGRAVVFPAFWTHTHRGQPCPNGKDRYILTAYINIHPKSNDNN
jgi:hypothetical protein